MKYFLNQVEGSKWTIWNLLCNVTASLLRQIMHEGCHCTKYKSARDQSVLRYCHGSHAPFQFLTWKGCRKLLRPQRVLKSWRHDAVHYWQQNCTVCTEFNSNKYITAAVARIHANLQCFIFSCKKNRFSASLFIRSMSRLSHSTHWVAIPPILWELHFFHCGLQCTVPCYSNIY